MARKGGRLNGSQSIPGRGGSKVVSNPAKPILSPEASATLRDELVGELKEIASADDAAVWAHRTLGVKNSLIEADGRQVENAFQAKLATFQSAVDISDRPLTPILSAPNAPPSLERHSVGPAGTATVDGIDKSRLTHPEPRRFDDKEHVNFVVDPSSVRLKLE